MNSNHSLGVLLGISSTFLYSIMDASIKFASLNYEFDFVSFYFQSTVLIALFLLIFGFFKLKTELFKIKRPFIVLIRSITTFLNFYLVFYVLRFLPLDIYYSIIFTAPIIASILAVFFLGEKFTFLKCVSLFIGFFGILIITNPLSTNFNQAYLIPIGITLFMSLCVALSGLITRKYLVDENSLKVTFYVFLFCSIASCLISFLRIGVETFSINNDTALFILINSVSCLIGFSLFFKAYQITPVQLVAPTEYALMIWGVFFGYIIFNNPTTINTLLGCAVVIVSNIIITIDSKKE